MTLMVKLNQHLQIGRFKTKLEQSGAKVLSQHQKFRQIRLMIYRYIRSDKGIRGPITA